MSNSMVPPSSSSEWDSSADDFGQKVDLAVGLIFFVIVPFQCLQYPSNPELFSLKDQCIHPHV